MTGFDYNILLSVFFVSYILFEMPANILTKVVGPGKMIPIYVSALLFVFGFRTVVTNLPPDHSPLQTDFLLRSLLFCIRLRKDIRSRMWYPFPPWVSLKT
jgi:hypothetical protein